MKRKLSLNKRGGGRVQTVRKEKGEEEDDVLQANFGKEAEKISKDSIEGLAGGPWNKQ